MSSYRGKIFDAFFSTDHGKGLLKTAQEKVGPTEDEVKKAHPEGGETTQVSNPGTGGEGQYDVPKSDVDGDGAPADGHVETIEEIAPTMEDVARKEATGKEGSIKSFTKVSKKEDKKEDKKGPGGHIPDGTGPHGRGKGPGKGKADGSGAKKDDKKDKKDKKEDKKEDKEDKMKKMRDKKKAFLTDLIKVADKLDDIGLAEEASMIDEIVQAESGLSVESFFHPDQYQGGEKKEKKEKKDE